MIFLALQSMSVYVIIIIVMYVWNTRMFCCFPICRRTKHHEQVTVAVSCNGSCGVVDKQIPCSTLKLKGRVALMAGALAGEAERRARGPLQSPGPPPSVAHDRAAGETVESGLLLEAGRRSRLPPGDGEAWRKA